MTATTEWYTRTQGMTVITADANGEPYTRDDLEFIAEFTNDATDADIALALGRTLAGIWNIQHRIKTGDIDLSRATRRDAIRHPLERAYTFIGDDVPMGWND
jgi:hypothetical protein